MSDALTEPTPVTDHPTSVTNVPFEPIYGAHLEHTAEAQPARWTFAAFDVAAAWTTSWMDYVNGALARRATPLDVFADAVRFWSTATARPEPTWSTPFTVVKEWRTVRLLDFSTEPGSDVVPTLILPPQAGHASTIVDYTPRQSQVRTAIDQGLTRLFVVEWLGATDETKDTTIEDYIQFLDEVFEHLGGRANLVGDCQGGWLATIYAALRPQAVTSLAVGAAPIDFHAGHGAIHDWTEAFQASGDPMFVYRALVGANDGVHNGEHQVTGFKMLEPAGELTRLADLWANIEDEEYVKRYRDFVAWFETPQNLAGAFYLWTVEHLFVNNELVNGELEVGGEKVDLSTLTMPIYLLAGSNDHITPPEQVWALADHVSTPKEDITSHFVEAGHLGLFMGRRALSEHWAPLFKSVKDKVGSGAPVVEESTTNAVTAPVEKVAEKVAERAVEATETKAAAPVVEESTANAVPAPAEKVAEKVVEKAAETTEAAPKRAVAPAQTPPKADAPAQAEPKADTPAQTAPKVDEPAQAVSTSDDAKAAPTRRTPAKRATSGTSTPAKRTPAKQTTARSAAPAKQAATAETQTAPATKSAPRARKTAAPATKAAAPTSKSTAPATRTARKSAPRSTGTAAAAAAPVEKSGPAEKAAPTKKAGPASKGTPAKKTSPGTSESGKGTEPKA